MRGAIRGEEERQVGDVLRPADAADRLGGHVEVRLAGLRGLRHLLGRAEELVAVFAPEAALADVALPCAARSSPARRS